MTDEKKERDPRMGVSTKPGYKRENRGVPMKPGQNWSDLTHQQRRMYFIQHENHWRKKFNERAGVSVAEHSMGRG